MALWGTSDKKELSMVATRQRCRSEFSCMAEPLEPRMLLADAPPRAGTIEGLNAVSTSATSDFFAVPATPSAAAGPSHVVNVVNTAIQWYTKSGTLENTQRLGRNSSGNISGSFF